MTRAAVPGAAPSRERDEVRPAALNGATGFRLRAAQFWIQLLVTLSQRVPGLMRVLRPAALWFAWNCSSTMRGATLANAARILGPEADRDRVTKLAKGVIASFYDFLFELGTYRRKSGPELIAEIQSVTGKAAYDEARQQGKGAILVTAHIGSFEVGAAALRQYEPTVHVVFQRDPMPVFEASRADQHRRLGLIEAAVDPSTGQDAWNVWLKLRDALRANEVVLMQGDRVMPGQRGRKIPFMGGHVMLPPGPVKLAMATGAPIVPVCAPRGPDGRIHIEMHEPIWIDESEPHESGPHPAELKLGKVLEGWVRRFPDQWLMIHRVWCEDRTPQGEPRTP